MNIYEKQPYFMLTTSLWNNKRQIVDCVTKEHSDPLESSASGL